MKKDYSYPCFYDGHKDAFCFNCAMVLKEENQRLREAVIATDKYFSAYYNARHLIRLAVECLPDSKSL